jgi:hypothetical protein
MGNDVEGIVITRLGHMHFVPSPGDTTFIPEVRIGVIRRVHAHAGRREVLGCPPTEVSLLVSIVLIHPGPSEDFDSRPFPYPAGSRCVINGVEQL